MSCSSGFLSSWSVTATLLGTASISHLWNSFQVPHPKGAVCKLHPDSMWQWGHCWRRCWGVGPASPQQALPGSSHCTWEAPTGEMKAESQDWVVTLCAFSLKIDKCKRGHAQATSPAIYHKAQWQPSLSHSDLWNLDFQEQSFSHHVSHILLCVSMNKFWKLDKGS